MIKYEYRRTRHYNRGLLASYQSRAGGQPEFRAIEDDKYRPAASIKMEPLAIRIVCSLVLVTVIFQIQLLILSNLSYHNVRSSPLTQHREIPGNGISDPWRVDFGNWQVDYCHSTLYVKQNYSSIGSSFVRWWSHEVSPGCLRLDRLHNGCRRPILGGQ